MRCPYARARERDPLIVPVPLAATLEALPPETIATMHSIVLVLGGGGRRGDRERAAPYLDRAREWMRSRPPASGLLIDTYIGLAGIISGPQYSALDQGDGGCSGHRSAG